MTGISPLRSFGITAAAVGFSAIPIHQAIKDAEAEHKSKLWAGVKSAVENSWQPLIMTGWGAFKQLRSAAFLGVLMQAGTLAGTAMSLAVSRNNFYRQAVTPFSHRFDHSDYTSAAQQRGMQTITGVRSMIGNEASAFNARYGRR